MSNKTYLVGTTEATAIAFTTKMFSDLQPAPAGATTTAWTSYVKHPNQDSCIYLLPEMEVPTKADADMSLLYGYLQTFVDDGTLTAQAVSDFENSINSKLGTRFDPSAELKTLFAGTDVLIDEAQAIAGGWIESAEV